MKVLEASPSREDRTAGEAVSANGSRRTKRIAGGARVMIVAPHRDRLLTEALARTLPLALPSVGAALRVDGFERAIQSCQRLRPSVVVTILHENTSKEVIRFADDLRRTCPEARLVMIADNDEDVVCAVEAGAMAVVPPSRGLQALIDAIVDTEDGRAQLDAEKLRRALHAAARRRLTRADVSRRLAQLTEREDHVLRLAAQGARNKDIASTLHISIRTVDTHITNMLKKLGVHSKLEASALLWNGADGAVPT